MWKAYYSDAMHFIARLDKQEWLGVLVAVTIIGFFCMRGFGSRSSY